MRKWQPIETAPRIHGKRVLLYKDCGPGSPPSISIGYAIDGILGWCADECYGFKTLEDYGYRVTHWMPLPEPPETDMTGYADLLRHLSLLARGKHDDVSIAADAAGAITVLLAERDALAARLAAAQHQPAEGEEIMVNTPYDVFILPLRPSGLDGKGPRFVVHVPGPEQTAAVDGLAARLVDELDGLVSESGGVSGLHLNGDVATWEELLPGGRFERLSSLDELREALAAQQQGGRADE